MSILAMRSEQNHFRVSEPRHAALHLHAVWTVCLNAPNGFGDPGTKSEAFDLAQIGRAESIMSRDREIGSRNIKRFARAQAQRQCGTEKACDKRKAHGPNERELRHRWRGRALQTCGTHS